MNVEIGAEAALFPEKEMELPLQCCLGGGWKRGKGQTAACGRTSKIEGTLS
jgi:hypothetical protein